MTPKLFLIGMIALAGCGKQKTVETPNPGSPVVIGTNVIQMGSTIKEVWDRVGVTDGSIKSGGVGQPDVDEQTFHDSLYKFILTFENGKLVRWKKI